MTESVVLLHGLLMRRPAMMPLAMRLRSHGYSPILFAYASLWRSPAKAMERLAMRLYGMEGPVHLVGHSLGGLIALETLNQYQQLPHGRVVCLGSPIAGSSAARGLADLGLGLMTGRSSRLLRGGLIQVPKRQVGAIAGGRSMGMGKWFGQLDQPNDGTVAVWETRLPGLADHLVIRSSHTGLAFSAEAAQHTAHFLRHGYF